MTMLLLLVTNIKCFFLYWLASVRFIKFFIWKERKMDLARHGTHRKEYLFLYSPLLVKGSNASAFADL